MTLEPPLVIVVVVNWNGLADTLECLGSLARLDYPNYDTVVVDNGSTDGSVPAIRERFELVMVVENSENLGYAGGNNIGLEHAMRRGADYALLLNNDTLVAPDCLCRLVAAAQADPEVGMAGPIIYYRDLPDVIWSPGGAIDWRRGSTGQGWTTCGRVGRGSTQGRLTEETADENSHLL